MAATPESKVKAKIHALFKAHGAYAVNYIGGMHANNGTPDILACAYGKFFGVEAKAGSNRPTDLQLSNLRRIYEAGGIALVINETNLDVLAAVLAIAKMGGNAPVENFTPYIRTPDEEDPPTRRRKA